MDILTYAAAVKKAKKMIEESSAAGVAPATTEQLGGIIVGENLNVTKNGTLSVVTANDAEEDNTHPITSAAVYDLIGNINELLSRI